jgi:hypothetical protein
MIIRKSLLLFSLFLILNKSIYPDEKPIISVLDFDTAMAFEVNSRVFLIGGDISMEFFGFILMGPYSNENYMIASSSTADDVSIRIRGYLRNGDPYPDKKVDKYRISDL